MVREGRVFKSQTGSGRPEYGVGYYVTAYEVGAEVAVGSILTTVTVRAGHGFSAGDKFIAGLDINRYRTVLSITDATTIEIDSNVPLAAGELLINLGQDTGSTEPNYDSNSLQIFSDMDYSNILNNATVWSDAVGRYRYHHRNIAIWELVRTPSNVPFAIYTDAHPIQDDLVTSVGIRYAHLFATTGDGTESNPWGFPGGNPVQEAINDLPGTGGTVEAIAGFYDLGSGANAVVIPTLTSTTDKRAYTIRGHGRDLTFFRYSGTGNAIVHSQVNDGTALGRSWQSNQIVLKGFAVQQTGTPRTGTGIFCTYISESLFEDLTVGNVRQDRQVGEDDFGFAYGIRFEGPAGDEVSDFNRFHRIYAMGNIHAMYLQNQADNTVISECSFEPRQGIGVEQDGVEISNSSGVTIEKSHFNFFNNSSTSFAIKLTTDVSGVVIQGNYFEANWNSIRLWSDGNQDGIIIQGNLFAMQGVQGLSGPTYVYGIFAGVNSNIYAIRGLVIQANQFQRIQDYSRGVTIGGDVRSYVLMNNRYEIEGTTDCFNNNRITQVGSLGPLADQQPGSQGITIEVFPESASTTNERPLIQVHHKEQDGTALHLFNTNAGSQKSPRLRFSPKSDLSLDFLLEASALGKLNFVNAAGAIVGTIDQAGVMSPGRLVFRSIGVDPTSVATIGSLGEAVYSTSTAKFYGKHTTSVSDTNWRLLGT